MRSLRLVLACLSFVLLATTLAADTEKQLGGSTAYYPLKIGNIWNYKAGESRFSYKFSKVETVNKIPCARIDLLVGGKEVSHEHIALTKEAVQRVSFEGKLATPPIDFLKLPPRAGTSWNVDSKVDGQILKGSFKMGEEDVTVLAGTYKKAITVTGADLTANGVPLSITYAFAENVGMVRQVVKMAGTTVVIELEKFEPAK